MVDKFLTTPESPKPSLKMKLKYGQIVNALAEVPAFVEELQSLCLTLLKVENLHQFTDYAVHEALIKLIEALYVPRGTAVS